MFSRQHLSELAALALVSDITIEGPRAGGSLVMRMEREPEDEE